MALRHALEERRLAVFSLCLLVAIAFVAIVAHPAPASAQTIGQTHQSDLTCSGGPFVALQTSVSGGNPYRVPAGSWELTSWTFAAGSSSGSIAAVVARPLGGTSYEIVAVSPLVSPTANAVNTFLWSAAVRGGDVLGLYVAGGSSVDCATATVSPLDTYDLAFVGGLPSPGETVSGSTGTNLVLDVGASLLPANDQGTVAHEFVCYSRFEQDGGEVFDSATGDALVAAGRWFPVALPGNVPEGDNVGAYHLACNPPSGYTPTGQSVSGGGDVFDGAAPGAYVIETSSG